MKGRIAFALFATLVLLVFNSAGALSAAAVASPIQRAKLNRTMAKPFKWTYQGKPLHV